MNERPPFEPGRGFHRYVLATVFFAVLLVWWGAATTTADAGMVFADWPLSLGSVNPPGWLSHLVPFLEHSHRLLATWVGLMVLGMFAWAFARTPRRALELAGLVALLAFVFGFYIVAGAERVDPDRKAALLAGASLSALLPVGWLAWSWTARRWSLLEKLSALALLAVTAQAILGGLRVTEVSDTFAVLHGCLGQFFFCLLVLIAMCSSPRRHRLGFPPPATGGPQGGGSRWPLRLGGAALLAMVSGQLLLGAWMRHHHRFGIIDDGLLRTRGQWVPPLDDANVAALFLHKGFAFGILLFVGAWLAKRACEGSRLLADPSARHLAAVLALIAAQVALGLAVIGTEKQFWVTNFHVLNGLAILAAAFAYLARAVFRPAEPGAAPQ